MLMVLNCWDCSARSRHRRRRCRASLFAAAVFVVVVVVIEVPKRSVYHLLHHHLWIVNAFFPSLSQSFSIFSAPTTTHTLYVGTHAADSHQCKRKRLKHTSTRDEEKRTISSCILNAQRKWITVWWQPIAAVLQ